MLQNLAKNITSFFHSEQKGKNLHYFADSCGSVCPSAQLLYWPHQQFRVRVVLEIFEGEMSPEVFRVLHQRELGTSTKNYNEGAPLPL